MSKKEISNNKLFYNQAGNMHIITTNCHNCNTPQVWLGKKRVIKIDGQEVRVYEHVCPKCGAKNNYTFVYPRKGWVVGQVIFIENQPEAALIAMMTQKIENEDIKKTLTKIVNEKTKDIINIKDIKKGENDGNKS